MVTTIALNATCCAKIVIIGTTPSSSCISILNLLHLCSARTRGQCCLLIPWIHCISHTNRLSAIIIVILTSALDQATLRFSRRYRLASPWPCIISCFLGWLHQVWPQCISLVGNHNSIWLLLISWAKKPSHAIFIHEPCIIFLKACSFILWTHNSLNRWPLEAHLVNLGGNWHTLVNFYICLLT